jgi:hypothetical protein
MKYDQGDNHHTDEDAMKGIAIFTLMFILLSSPATAARRIQATLIAALYYSAFRA